MSLVKINDNVWMTPNGVVDFSQSARLSPSEEAHNRIVDFEVAMAKSENEHRKMLNDMRLKAWEQYLLDHPDQKYRSCPGLDMTSPKIVISMKYSV